MNTHEKAGSKRLAARWSGFGTSIFTEMTELAKRHSAVNLAQGFPDFPGPSELLEATSRHLHTSSNQYAPSIGEEPLREAVSRFVFKQTGVYYDPKVEVTITTGATEAIYSVVNAFVNPGDRVVVFEPFYDSYAQAIANAGGVLVPVRLHAPDTPLGLPSKTWAIDWEEFDAAAAGGFKFLILNSPHNPTGKVFSQDELERIAAKVLKNDAIVMCDEVYEHLLYDGTQHLSLCSLEKIQSRVVRVSSAAKTFGFTGFKVGWVTAPAELTSAVRLVHQGTVFCTPPFLQMAYAELMANETWLDCYLSDFRKIYAEKRDFLKATLERAGFFVHPCTGTYFLMANFESLAGDVSDVVFAKQLIETHSVAAIPPSVFYLTPPRSLPWLRFAFCKSDETLRRAHDLLLR